MSKHFIDLLTPQPHFQVLYVTSLGLLTRTVTRGAKPPLENFSPPLEKCVGHSFKILDIVQKIWAPLGKLFDPPGVPSWLRACF